MDSTVTSPYKDKPDPWSSHSTICKWLGRFAPGTRVLDVGTATGTVGRLCQGHDLLLDGLEPNPDWAQYARPYYHEVRVGMLDDAPETFLAGHSVVILADVLEHMPVPEAALKRLVMLQPPGAVFIISVPNIANLWVRINLLFGRFDYAEHGILDRTHLHFFTRKTFMQLAKSAGLSIRELRVTAIPLPLVSPFFEKTVLGRFFHRGLAAVTGIFPTLLGYQLIAELVKNE